MGPKKLPPQKKTQKERNPKHKLLVKHPKRYLPGVFFGEILDKDDSFHDLDIMIYVVNHGWLVVSTHLKSISQNGNLPQVTGETKNVSNHHLDGDR